jgi:predicted dehydrogenase
MTEILPKLENPVRLAMVGLGGHGRTIQRAVAAVPALQVVAVYDPDASEARAAAERFGCGVAPSFRSLLERDDVEAVTLVTPNHLHRAQAVAALEAGMDVFVEKPLANTVADGRAMVRAAETKERILMVGHHMRWSRPARRARALVARGALGRIVSAEVHFSSDTARELPAGSWRLQPEAGPLLPMMQLGIHGIDLLHYLIGRVETVQARVASVTTTPPVVDHVAVLMGLVGGRSALLVTNYCTPVRFTWHLAATEGSLTGTPHTLSVTDRRGVVVETLDVSADPCASYVEQMAAFAHVVRNRSSPESDGHTGLQALAVVEAIQAGLARRATVEVPARPSHARNNPS